MREIKITPAISALLTAIRSKEAPKGYGQVYSGAPGAKNVNVSVMTLDGVLAWQAMVKKKGTKSTAAGAYQFINATLKATIAEMGLKGSEKWTPELQDKMAVYLMQKRGFGEYLDGKITAEQFANNLAKEWASLPVVTEIQGQKRKVKPGQSYYSGDGLNKAHHDPKAILALVKAIKAPEKPVQDVSPAPAAVSAYDVKPPPEVKSEAPTRLGWLDRIRRIWA